VTFRLVAFDLDGTMLRSDGSLSEENCRVLQALRKRGVVLVPSSGRPFCGIQNLSERLPGNQPMIACNGAYVVMSEDHHVLAQQCVPLDLATEVYRLGIARGFPVALWVGDQLFVSIDNAQTRAYQAINGVPFQVIDGDDLKVLFGKVTTFSDNVFSTSNGITKLLWIINPEEGVSLQTQMHDYFNSDETPVLQVHISRPYLLEFVDMKATKGNALQVIGKELGISLDEMIAIGDSYNDISMLKVAGLSIAMANAPKEVQEICHKVTLSNDEDGAGIALQRIFSREEGEMSII